MDPAPFSNRVDQKHIWEHRVLINGTRNASIGFALLFALRYLESIHWLLAGWIVCAGIALILHFGLFHILAWHWRGMGYKVAPIMQFPLISKTISEFWGKRWNVAFGQLVRPLLFKPLSNLFGPRWGMLTTFLVSGGVHELAISLPARGGWGLPTLYFLIQALGMLIERSKSRGFPHRIFTLIVVLGPAYMLFHPPFMKTVILPFADFLGLINKEILWNM